MNPHSVADWNMLRQQLLVQWRYITARELDSVGPNHGHIAQLIERKYGIKARFAENYLHNFERTMPMAA